MNQQLDHSPTPEHSPTAYPFERMLELGRATTAGDISAGATNFRTPTREVPASAEAMEKLRTAAELASLGREIDDLTLYASRLSRNNRGGSGA